MWGALREVRGHPGRPSLFVYYRTRAEQAREPSTASSRPRSPTPTSGTAGTGVIGAPADSSDQLLLPLAGSVFLIVPVASALVMETVWVREKTNLCVSSTDCVD